MNFMNFLFFLQLTNSTCIHNNIICACIAASILNLCPNKEDIQLFKVIPNMNGFVLHLLTKMTIQGTF